MEGVVLKAKDYASRVTQSFNDRINDPKSQRQIVLLIVCVALLLDNMLYMVIVPIIPQYLTNKWREEDQQKSINLTVVVTKLADSLNQTIVSGVVDNRKLGFKPPPILYDESGGAIGFLFASKAIVQLFVNPFSGTIIDKVGYDIPMLAGLIIMFLSTATFAFGESYTLLFIARSLQGLGSAFADTAGMAMIADRYTEEGERRRSLGIAIAFISFGSLVAPPFGGVMYEFAGKFLPFFLLALVCLADGILLLIVMKPVRQMRSLVPKEDRPKGTPIYKLFMDPYVAIIAGALAMSNVSLAFLEPTISMWMWRTMNSSEWEMGFVWLPAFFPHVLGVYMTVKLARKYPRLQWFMAALGLSLEGLFCALIPFTESFVALIIPISVVCFGIALVDTSLMPTLGYVVDVRHVSVYGSVYAIADISYSIAYAFGPIVAGSLVATIGFTWLNMAIMVSNLGYAPLLMYIRNIYDYKPFENEDDTLDPQIKGYSSYNGDATTDFKAFNKQDSDYSLTNGVNDKYKFIYEPDEVEGNEPNFYQNLNK